MRLLIHSFIHYCGPLSFRPNLSTPIVVVAVVVENRNRIPPVATGTKKRAAAEVGGNPPSVATTAVTKDPPPPPFLHRLISLLQAYHEAIHEDKYVTLSILTTQLIDKHPLCQLLLLHSNATTANNSASTSTTATTTNLATDESSGGVAVQDQFVYWLYLASHCLEKLVQYNNSLLQSNAAATTDFDGSAPTTTSISAAWLSYTITQALLSMLPAKQERLNTSAARHLVGRALILVATAATEALSQLSSISSSSSSDNLSGTSGSGRNKSNNKDAAASNGSSIVVSASIQACVLALDSVTMVHSSPLTDSHEYWSQCVPSWRESIHAVWTDHSKTLQQYMLSSSHELDWTLEWTCCQLLSNSTSISSTTVIAPRAGIAAPGKRVSSRGSSHTATSARAGSTTASSAETTNILPAATLLQTMEALIHQDSSQHGVGLESRLALKRWTAASLTWYAPSGQEKLLAAADRLLQRDKKSTWVSVCERNVVIGLLPSRLEPTATLPIEDSMNEDSTIENNMCASMDESFESLVQSKKKKSKSPERQAAPNFVKVPVPDNVSFITLVCRLIRIVWEIGNNAGVRPPPSGGYDTYMKSLTGTVLKKNKKLCRADLRDVAMSVAYHLIQCHHDSLRENYGSKCDKCVINEDDDDVLRRRTLSSKSKMVPIDGVDHLLYMSLFSYYPFVHQAVVELSNAAAASAAGSSLTQLFRWSDRIEFASSAFIFSTQEQILDLRLTGYAMEKLVSCLSSKPSLSSGVTADAAVSSPTISSNSSAKKKKDVWKLDVPLPTPCFQQQKRVAKSVQSRKRKSHVDREEATFCTFAGVFDDRGKGGDGAALPELSFDEKLSLFIRATRGDSLLASHLIWIVEACYDTRTPRDPIAATSTDEINVDVRTEAGKRKTNDHSSGKSKKRRKQNVDVSSAESMACEGLPPLRYR